MGRFLVMLASLIVQLLLLALGVAGNSDGGQLYVFGDSNVDTGNNVPGIPKISRYWSPPYGISWPGYPFGRYSDGQLFTDFYASYQKVETPVTFRSLNISTKVFVEDGLEEMNLEVGEAEMLNDKLHYSVDTIKTGINFAIAGSGAFSVNNSFAYNVSVQIERLRTTIDLGIVSTQDLANSTALLVINGNDYLNYISLHSNLKGVENFIPMVVAQIVEDAKELSGFGFKNIVISTLGPYGCVPYFTSLNNYSECNDIINLLASFHNNLLALEVSSLQKELPSSFFEILDLYNAVQEILESDMFTFPLEPCCEGIGGKACGTVDEDNNPQYKVCSNRDQHLFWDGVHFTYAGWKAVSSKLFPSSQYISST